MSEIVLRVRKKGVTILPKHLREAAGIAEDSEIKAKALPSGILLRPLGSDPVGTLESLPTGHEGSAVVTVRKLRRKIDRQLRG